MTMPARAWIGRRYGMLEIIGPGEHLETWAIFMETADRHVADTYIGALRISTVFLGLDHSFSGPEPLLFETMIFDGGDDHYQTRSPSWDEALLDHQTAVQFALELHLPTVNLLAQALRNFKPQPS